MIQNSNTNTACTQNFYHCQLKTIHKRRIDKNRIRSALSNPEKTMPANQPSKQLLTE